MNKEESLDMISILAHEKKKEDFNARENLKFRELRKRVEDLPLSFFRYLYWTITGYTTRKSKKKVLQDVGNLFLKIANE